MATTPTGRVYTMAFVIAWGYYGIPAQVVLPGLERSLAGPALGRSVRTIERRVPPSVGLLALLCAATGSYLLVASPQCGGLGGPFARPGRRRIS